MPVSEVTGHWTKSPVPSVGCRFLAFPLLAQKKPEDKILVLKTSQVPDAQSRWKLPVCWVAFRNAGKCWMMLSSQSEEEERQ